MKKTFEKIDSYLRGLSTIKFIMAMVALTFLIILVFIPVFLLYEKYIGEMGGASNIKESSLILKIIVASLIVPFLETLVFQYGVIEILNLIKGLKGKNIIIVVISALLFGASHCYSYLYMFFGFLIGLLLAYSYLVYKEKKFSAFWVVFWIHCIRNSISTILSIFD